MRIENEQKANTHGPRAEPIRGCTGTAGLPMTHSDTSPLFAQRTSCAGNIVEAGLGSPKHDNSISMVLRKGESPDEPFCAVGRAPSLSASIGERAGVRCRWRSTAMHI